MSKTLDESEKEVRDQAVQDIGIYVDKLYKEQHVNKRRVKCIITTKDGKVGEANENQFGLPFLFEDVVLILNNKYDLGTRMIGGVDIDDKNIKSIEVVFE